MSDKKPTNLEEAFLKLGEGLTTSGDYNAFKNEKKKDLIQFHHTMGRWIRNNFGLWAEDGLHAHMKELGFTHADDMSSVIINAFHARINDYEFDIKAEAERYKEYWEKNKD